MSHAVNTETYCSMFSLQVVVAAAEIKYALKPGKISFISMKKQRGFQVQICGTCSKEFVAKLYHFSSKYSE